MRDGSDNESSFLLKLRLLPVRVFQSIHHDFKSIPNLGDLSDGRRGQLNVPIACSDLPSCLAHSLKGHEKESSHANAYNNESEQQSCERSNHGNRVRIRLVLSNMQRLGRDEVCRHKENPWQQQKEHQAEQGIGTNTKLPHVTRPRSDNQRPIRWSNIVADPDRARSSRGDGSDGRESYAYRRHHPRTS